MNDPFGVARDRSIVRALERARIDVFRLDRPEGEPRSRVRGRIGPIEIARGPSCWVADGPVPLTAARALYKHPIGRREIRIWGCAAPSPPKAPWVIWYTADGERVYPVAYREALRAALEASPGILQRCPPILCHDEPSYGMTGYIDQYHLDSDESLHVFAATLRAYAVDDDERPAWWARHTLSREHLALLSASIRSRLLGSWDGDTEPLDDND